jgi:hypothetical protein
MASDIGRVVLQNLESTLRQNTYQLRESLLSNEEMYSEVPFKVSREAVHFNTELIIVLLNEGNLTLRLLTELGSLKINAK